MKIYTLRDLMNYPIADELSDKWCKYEDVVRIIDQYTKTPHINPFSEQDNKEWPYNRDTLQSIINFVYERTNDPVLYTDWLIPNIDHWIKQSVTKNSETLQKAYDNLVESYRTIFEENRKLNVLLEAARAFTNISNDEYTDELYDKLVEAVKSIDKI